MPVRTELLKISAIQKPDKTACRNPFKIILLRRKREQGKRNGFHCLRGCAVHRTKHDVRIHFVDRAHNSFGSLSPITRKSDLLISPFSANRSNWHGPKIPHVDISDFLDESGHPGTDVP